MIFTQAEFVIFLIVVLVAAWMAGDRRLRNLVLLVASYYFYAYWDIRFCVLLMLSTLVDFGVGQKLESSADPNNRKRWLIVSIVVNLSILGFFKYFNFFVASATALLSPIGISTQTLPILLPVGVSFFTFQTMSYTIDIYRRKISSCRSLPDFALYVAFFPQLVAGPIVRASELLPQLAAVPVWSRRRMYGGFQQALRGTVKKVLIADRLGEMVDVVFAGPELYSGATLWIAAVAYAGQIYYDFSGYTDIAIGVAKMLGYRFPKNFRHPYLATNIADFWRRWHMTLSRWLRDYLYIPLGGNRHGTAITLRNLMLTMTLGGLWHGAAWTFVVWGALHGTALCIHATCSNRVAANRPARSLSEQLFGWLATATIVVLGWILFRSQGIGEAGSYLYGMLSWQSGIDWYPPLSLLAIACMIAEHSAWRTSLRPAMRLPADAWYSPIATTVMLWSLALYAPKGFRPFVYFQF